MRTLHLATLVAIALAGFAIPATAQERDNLTGIGSIIVVVETIGSDAERDGLRRTMVQTAVELRLRRNGIPVADAAPSALFVAVNTLRHSELDGAYAFCVKVRLVTAVQVEATGRTVVGATIWSVNAVGLVGTSNARTLRDSVLELVDQFSNDYLAVNPR